MCIWTGGAIVAISCSNNKNRNEEDEGGIREEGECEGGGSTSNLVYIL